MGKSVPLSLVSLLWTGGDTEALQRAEKQPSAHHETESALRAATLWHETELEHFTDKRNNHIIKQNCGLNVWGFKGIVHPKNSKFHHFFLLATMLM